MLVKAITATMLFVLISLFLAALVRAEITETNRAYLVSLAEEQGLAGDKLAAFKAELADDCGKCSCPTGFAMIISPLGAVTCQRLCFKVGQACAGEEGIAGSCRGEAIFARPDCTIFQSTLSVVSVGG